MDANAAKAIVDTINARLSAGATIYLCNALRAVKLSRKHVVIADGAGLRIGFAAGGPNAKGYWPLGGFAVREG